MMTQLKEETSKLQENKNKDLSTIIDLKRKISSLELELQVNEAFIVM